MRTAFRYLAALVFVGVVVQVGLAGVGAFHSASKNDDGPLAKEKVSDWFGPHAGLGYLLVLLALVLLVVGLLTRDRGWRNRSAILLGLFVLQVILAWIGAAAWALGFLHPINALAIFAFSGMLAHAAWRSDGREAAVV